MPSTRRNSRPNPDFARQDARSANRLRLIAILSDITRRFTKAELVARLGGRMPFGPVMNIAEIAEDPHFAAREMIVTVDEPGQPDATVAGVPVKMTATPGGVRRRAPFLGEHTRVRLIEAGLTEDEIEGLIARREAAGFDTNERNSE